MGIFTQILLIVLAIFLGWQLYRYIRTNPQAFSSQNINRSIFTLGIICLIIIAFIAFLVMLLKTSG